MVFASSALDRDDAPTTVLHDERAEVALVEAACRGDRAAFARLYQMFAKMVHGLLLARVPAADADDLTQDVFVLAYRQLPALRDPLAFGGWLATIARRRAVDFHRRERDQARLTGPDAIDRIAAADASAASAPSVPSTSDEAAGILDAIRRLPEAYREPMILRLCEGMTGPEIAARTGLTPGSVRVNLHRGMKKLREELAGSTR